MPAKRGKLAGGAAGPAATRRPGSGSWRTTGGPGYRQPALAGPPPKDEPRPGWAKRARNAERERSCRRHLRFHESIQGQLLQSALRPAPAARQGRGPSRRAGPQHSEGRFQRRFSGHADSPHAVDLQVIDQHLRRRFLHRAQKLHQHGPGRGQRHPHSDSPEEHHRLRRQRFRAGQRGADAPGHVLDPLL